jgi:hypothetical protein
MLLTICGVHSDTLFYYFAELAQIKNTPTDSELVVQIDETESKVRVCTHPLFFFWSCIIITRTHPKNCIIHICITICFLFFSKQVAKLREHLEPLRAGTPLVSTAELNELDAEWTKWRSEWVKRRKVFYKCGSPCFSLSSPRALYGNVSSRAD